MQWGWDGKPTWHAPRLVGVWAMPAFALAVRLFIFAAVTYAPDKVHSADVGLLLLSVIAAGVHVWMLRRCASGSA